MPKLNDPHFPLNCPMQSQQQPVVPPRDPAAPPGPTPQATAEPPATLRPRRLRPRTGRVCAAALHATTRQGARTSSGAAQRRGSDREALSPFGATCVQHGPSAARAHAFPKAMGALALNHGRLKGSLSGHVAIQFLRISRPTSAKPSIRRDRWITRQTALLRTKPGFCRRPPVRCQAPDLGTRHTMSVFAHSCVCVVQLG